MKATDFYVLSRPMLLLGGLFSLALGATEVRAAHQGAVSSVKANQERRSTSTSAQPAQLPADSPPTTAETTSQTVTTPPTKATPQTSPQDSAQTLSPTGSLPRDSNSAPTARTVKKTPAPRQWRPREFLAHEEPQSPSEVAYATVLDSGIRVIVAQDDSLPVAAVVLALPFGERDDPQSQRGLIHGLSYFMQMGNRQLSPGAILDEVYESGGYAEMAFGSGQVRYESLVPQWSANSVIRVESLRFATPSLSAELWTKALYFAGRDERPAHAPNRNMRSLAWQDPALDHDGRKVDNELPQIPLPALHSYIVRYFSPASATLVVVAPGPLENVLATIEKAFAELPSEKRRRIEAPTPPVASSMRRATRKKTKNDTIVRAVSPAPNARLMAKLLCTHLRRRGMAKDHPTLPKIRCKYRDSATHPYLQIRIAAEFDPPTILRERLQRISQGLEDHGLERFAQRAYAEQRHSLSTPLALARSLATTPEWPNLQEEEGLDTVMYTPARPPSKRMQAKKQLQAKWSSLSLASLTGLETLGRSPDAAAIRQEPAMQALLNPESYVMLLRPDQAESQTSTKAQADGTAGESSSSRGNRRHKIKTAANTSSSSAVVARSQGGMASAPKGLQP